MENNNQDNGRDIVLITIRCSRAFRERVKEWAKRNRRSMEGAIFVVVSDAVRSDKPPLDGPEHGDRYADR
jgi:hypothetical protein